jgi:dTDP-L-rhamnose 4-epimerase
MTRILVTGGAGFIGSHIADALLVDGHEVVVLDRETGHTPDDVETIRGDVRDPDVVARALAGVEAVSHQAAKVGLGVDLLDIADYASENDLGTAILLRELARARFAGRLVLASSMVVYGEGRYACTRHGLVPAPPRDPDDLAAGRFEPRCPRCGEPLAPEPVPEDAASDPRNVYAATKLHQEHLAAVFGRELGAPVTALRYHNVYGPRMPRDTPYAGVAALFADAFAAGRAPRVFEDGGQLRDFVHVRDVARANVLALTRREPAPGAFNVASGTPRTIAQLAAALHAAVAPDGPAPQVTGEFRLGDVRHVFASPALAAETLSFRAREEFADGIAEFAAVRA